MSEQENVSHDPENVPLVEPHNVEHNEIDLVENIITDISNNSISDVVVNIVENIITDISNNSISDVVVNIVENIITDISNNIVNDLSSNVLDNNNEFCKILLNVLNNSSEKVLYDKIISDIIPNINISADTLNIILNLDIFSESNELNDVYKCILEIVKDNKIDSKDIPQFILLIERIHKIVVNIKEDNFKSKQTIEITELLLKFIFHVLVEKDIIGDPERKPELLKDIDDLINACIRLLNFSVEASKSEIASNFFNKLKDLFFCRQ